MPDKLQIQSFIQKFGQDVVNAQKQELQKKNSVATSRLLNSVNYRFKASIEKIIIEFVSEDYGKFVDEGRKPGKFPPLNKIKAWTKVKGIPEKAAFPIAKKIWRFGIKPKPFIQKPFDRNRQGFVVELIKLYSKEIISDVKSAFKKA